MTIDQGTCIVRKKSYLIAFGGLLRSNQIVTISSKGFKECTRSRVNEIIFLFYKQTTFDEINFFFHPFERET